MEGESALADPNLGSVSAPKYSHKALKIEIPLKNCIEWASFLPSSLSSVSIPRQAWIHHARPYEAHPVIREHAAQVRSWLKLVVDFLSERKTRIQRPLSFNSLLKPHGSSWKKTVNNLIRIKIDKESAVGGDSVKEPPSRTPEQPREATSGKSTGLQAVPNKWSKFTMAVDENNDYVKEDDWEQ